MKTSDIVLHMQENLPKFSTSFSTSQQATDISVVGTTVTVTMTGHGYTTNNVVSVVDSAFLIPVTDIDVSGDTVIFTTGARTDLTTGETSQVYLSSATQPSIDGNYPLVNAIHNYDDTVWGFELSTFPNTALTDVVLHDQRDFCINGLYSVTVVDANTFTFQLPDAIPETLDIDTVLTTFHSEIRVFGASEIERAVKTYELQSPGVIWAVVVLDDSVTSKDSNITTDAVAEQGNLNHWRCFQNTPFSVYLFIPTENNLTGRIARDSAETEKPNLFKTLLNAKFDTLFDNSATSTVVPVNDGKFEYKKNHYIHQFVFSQMVDVSLDDVYYAGKTRNFNNIQFDIVNPNEDNDEVIMSTFISLD